MQVFMGIINALIALPKIGSLIESAITAIVIARQKARDRKVAREIENAAIITANAKTKEQRREAAKKWADTINM